MSQCKTDFAKWPLLKDVYKYTKSAFTDFTCERGILTGTAKISLFNSKGQKKIEKWYCNVRPYIHPSIHGLLCFCFCHKHTTVTFNLHYTLWNVKPGTHTHIIDPLLRLHHKRVDLKRELNIRFTALWNLKSNLPTESISLSRRSDRLPFKPFLMLSTSITDASKRHLPSRFGLPW